MRLIMVRHGEPNYEKDCLTETGHIQAEAAARRLMREGIEAIYASPCGRTRETAEHTARMLHLPITTLDYMHEISWGGDGIPCDGHPWTLGDQMLEENFDFFSDDWRKSPYFDGNAATDYAAMIAEKIDGFLQGFGYMHERTRYFCQADTEKTVALFSHGGSGACVLAHLLTLPFPYVASVLPYDFTSIISIRWPVRQGTYVHARLELFNDCAHIHPAQDGPRIQDKPDAALQAACSS